MKIYLVGGAVRDQLLGLLVKERDWVVVGATVDEMLKLGFRQVGKDFPVFLHPKTNEEYALARMERKVGLGYTGFTFDTSADVTLEEDLIRRDVTINAIAQTPEGELIDPYGGKNDLDKKILRHVSEAFIEDPVRILRVARFTARFAELGFSVAPETMQLMKKMVQMGEVDALVAERVWKELEKALIENHPEKFFEVLAGCGALNVLFPLFNSSEEYKASLKTLINSSKISHEPRIRFAAFLQKYADEQIKELCNRYRVPSEYRELALLVSNHFAAYQNAEKLSAENILKLLQVTDAFRREQRFQDFLKACEACISSTDFQSELLISCFNAAKKVDTKEFLHLSGKDIANAIAEKRKAIIQDIINSPSISMKG